MVKHTTKPLTKPTKAVPTKKIAKSKHTLKKLVNDDYVYCHQYM